MKKTRIAVIGLFHGMNHVRSAIDCDIAELVGLCDLKETYRKDARILNVPFYQDFQELLEKENPEGVISSSP